LTTKPALAAEVGRRVFPTKEAAVIADIIARDVAFYQPQISPEAVAGLNGFAQAAGLLNEPVAYDDLVATRFNELWTADA
jgi:NitT/TauT family transport system substrate-binding protein